MENKPHDAEAIEHMRFVRVNVVDGPYCSSHGYLTSVSGAMLLVELRRHGFDVVKIVRREPQPFVFEDYNP